MKKYSRYAVEEIIRRGLKKDTQPINKKEILQVLVPNYQEIVQAHRNATQEKINAEQMLAASDNTDEYAMYMQKANVLRSAHEGQNQAPQQMNDDEEEKKDIVEESKVDELKTIE